jgi:Tol biopolymer transport system component
MERPPHDRAAFVAQACASDSELRREVESLLAHEGRADELLESPAWNHVSPPDETGTMGSAGGLAAGGLPAGSVLAAYRIVGKLGAGGMGEVYRATDTKLQREVAIKVLAPEFAHDSAWLSRFQREARVLASLNHSHIAAIYGLEESNGVRAIAMELVEGPTLAERIARSRIPVKEALTIARQIAEALEYAHEKGIVHRDLKPANVKLRPDGVVKVLDFGLAKAVDANVGVNVDADAAPTVTATRLGVIMGTPAYMAPEQAAGMTVDRRADIWAFGAVLFEMLSGRQIYARKTTLETLAAVARDEPRWDELPAETPAGVVRLLRSCLEKDPKQRLQAIGDWRLLLDDQPPPAKARDAKLPWIAAGAMTTVAAALAIALWAPGRAEKPVDRPLVRLDVDLGADVSLPAPILGGTSVVISPDGTRLVYASGTPPKLFIRRLDQPKATELPGTQGALPLPFFSPDGQWVGFRAGNQLNKISVEGGAVVPLGNTVSFAGASWSADGSIFVSEYLARGLLRIPAGGGPPETVAGLGNGEMALGLPQILPGGKAILLVAATTPRDVDQYTIEVLTLSDRHRKIVARGGASPRYLATFGGAGHLIYVNKATLFAIPFDLDKLETHGTAVPVLNDVAYSPIGGTGQFDFSRAPNGHGTLVYRRDNGAASGMMTLQWVDPTGRKEPLRAKSGVYLDPSLSPDGKQVALTVGEGRDRDVWVYEPQRDAMTHLSFGGGPHYNPIWSPDGQYVVFTAMGSGIVQARADGSRQPQALTQSKAIQLSYAFTPDGKRLAYDDYGAGRSQIWTVPLEVQGSQLKAGKPEQFLKSGFSDSARAFSPDGRWLAYDSNESGKNEVYVRAFPPPPAGPGGKWQISNGGGYESHWSRNGHDLFYRLGDQIMAASYTVKGDTFVAGTPRVWIAKLGGTKWDLAPDGKRVLVLTPAESAEAPKQEHEVVLLENFLDYLRQRVPLK